MPNHPPSAEPDDLPPESVRTALSLFLFLHLFALAVAVIAYGNPLGTNEQVSLTRRLLDVLSPYIDTLNLNPGHRFRLPAPRDRPILPVARYYLTHSTETDVDFSLEVEAITPAGAPEKVVIPPADLWPRERRRRYQSLTNAVGSLAGNERTSGSDSVELVLPRAIAGSILREKGARRGVIHCRAHLLQSMADVDSSDATVRDPFNSRYYTNVLEAQVLISGGRVDLLKSTAAGEVAPVDKGQ